MNDHPNPPASYPQQGSDYVNRIIAAAVFIAVATIYSLTVAPTFSFWDCGEFVACCYTLGIAHPPGSPLYLIIGRLFSVLPFLSDPGFGVNILSVLSSAGAALFGYLIVQRLIAGWGGAGRLASYAGGVIGALMLACGRTAWTNGVEAEVYGLTMLMLTAVFYLAVLAFEASTVRRRMQYLALAAYLMTLGAGVHMTVFLAAPVLLALFALRSSATAKVWYAFALFIAVELFLIFAFSSQPAEIPTFVPVALVTAVLFFHVFSLERAPLALLVTGGLAAVSLWPLYFAIWREASGADLSGTALSLSGWPLETVGLTALALWGAYHAAQTLRVWLRERRLPGTGSAATAVYTAAIFLAIAATMTEPNYKMFVGFSGALGVGLIVAFRRQFNVVLALAAVGVALAIMGFWQFTFGVLGAAAVISVIDLVNTLQLSTRSRRTSAVIGVIAVGLFFAFTDFHTTKPGLFTIALGALALAGVALRARAGSATWRMALATLALAGIAFSVNTYVPIRSAQGPSINQNNPSRSINAFVGYFERKQYGRQSMITRMFKRRAEWKNQFGSHQRMGFAGFFREQFGGNAGSLAIVVVLAALGVWELTRRSPGRGAVFITVLLLGTVGLVLYMNFADGTRMIGGRDYLEVRDRDYFYTPGFMFFGLAVGLGVAALMQIVRDSLASAARFSGPATIAVAVIALALPALAISDNFEACNRSGNYIPYDYAKNLLDSADPNAVLITGGDNDTFPLWALQEVYGYRTDVAVMILSLSNTDWYLKHMRDFWDVPLNLSDEQIDALRPVRHPDGRFARIQDQIVDYLVLTQPNHQRPINFAVTVSPGQRRLRGQSMENRLTLRGRAYRVRSDSAGFAIDYAGTDSLYTQAFSFRSLGKDGVNQNTTSRGMTNGYATGFLLLADHYRAQRDWDNALRVMSRAYEILPGLVQVNDEYVRILAAAGRVEEIYPILERLPQSHMLDIVKRWVQRARGDGRIEEAVAALSWAHGRAPRDRDVFYGLVALELEHKNYETVERLLSGWVSQHPQDSTAVGLLNQLQRGLQQGEL